MSWNATVDRLGARAQHDDLLKDERTRRLLYEAVDEITRLARRVPNPDDLRLVLGLAANDPSFHNADSVYMGLQRAAVFRVRATLEGTE